MSNEERNTKETYFFSGDMRDESIKKDISEMIITGLEQHQLMVTDDLFKKFEEIEKELEITNKKMKGKELVGLTTFYVRIIEVLNIMFHKYFFNDGLLFFKVENILNYKIGEGMI